jgi:hypothetical protein
MGDVCEFTSCTELCELIPVSEVLAKDDILPVVDDTFDASLIDGEYDELVEDEFVSASILSFGPLYEDSKLKYSSSPSVR